MVADRGVRGIPDILDRDLVIDHPRFGGRAARGRFAERLIILPAVNRLFEELIMFSQFQ
jgi:hypothetical protein